MLKYIWTHAPLHFLYKTATAYQSLWFVARIPCTFKSFTNDGMGVWVTSVLDKVKSMYTTSHF